MATPFTALDPRRPPFAWAPFAILPPSQFLIKAWVATPVLIACFVTSAAMAVGGTYAVLQPFGLIIIAVFVFDLPVALVKSVEVLRERHDSDGHAVTLSIYLHFLMRAVRGIGMSIAAVLVTVGLIPGLDKVTLHWAATAVGLGMAFNGLCNLAIPFRDRIDGYGSGRGFAEWYEPRDGPRGNDGRAKRSPLLALLSGALFMAFGLTLTVLGVLLMSGRYDLFVGAARTTAKSHSVGAPGVPADSTSPPKAVHAPNDSAESGR